MSRLILICAFFSLLFVLRAAEPNKFTISGYVKDAVTGEYLIGATVYDKESFTGVATNTYGFYSLTLPEESYSIVYTFVGYNNIEKKVKLQENIKIDISLEPSDIKLDEVVITSERKNQNVISTQMSVETLEMTQIEKLPVLFGEKDILKTIQLLPGISTVSEGGNGFSVRGGSIDQNLILLDEAPVYSASHLMGFFSIFNADVLKNIEVYKGGIPANYGGRASSVLDIAMRDGNSQKLVATGGLGLISSRLTVEGPIVNDKSSFILSGRRSYLDLVAKGADLVDNAAKLYFYDLNAKLYYKIDDENRIYLSGYFGQDDFGFGEVGMGWGNTTTTLRWNHLFSSRLFSNTSFIYSKYNYGFVVDEKIDMSSGIVDYGLKQDLSFYINPDLTVRFGWNSVYHIFNPGELIYQESNTNEIVLDKKKALESALYFSNEQKIVDKISLDYGVRFSMFNQFGSGWANVYNDDNAVVSSEYYENGKIMQNYFAFEPRLAVNFILSHNSSVKASYNRMSQYLHLMSNSTSGQPTDTWMPSSTNIKPLLVNQMALGHFRNFFNNQYEFSIEAYYKRLQNITDYKDGANILLNEHIESYILQGEGRSMGGEFYLKKRRGKLTGWVSYTLSKSENKIPKINDYKWYPSKLDKTHDISVVGSYQLSKKLSLSATWIFYTGNAVTFPSGKYEYGGTTRPYYTERNRYRMPDYHRLDFNLHWVGAKTRRFQSSWDFSIYNVYNRHNAYTITFRENEDHPNSTEAVKLSLFGIIPSVTWNFKF